MNSYHVIIILILFMVLYGGSFLLMKKGSLSLAVHRRVWNLILLVSFLGVAFSGLILALILDLDIPVRGYRTLLWYHVEFGIAMAIVGLFHAFWHAAYYVCMFRRKPRTSTPMQSCGDTSSTV